MKNVLAVLFSMLLVVTLVGCDSNDDDDNGDDTTQTAQVRFVHSSPDAGPVDVFLDDQEVAGDFAYSASPVNASDYLDVPVGTDATIEVRAQDGTVVNSVSVDQANLAADARYTVIVAGAVAATTEAPEAILLRDQFPDLGAGQIGLRLVHGSALAEDNFANGVDVYIAEAGQDDLSGLTPLVADFTFTQDTGSRLLGTSGAFATRELSSGPQQSVYVTAAGGTQPALEVPIGQGTGELPITEGAYVTGIAADIPTAEGGLAVGAQAIIEDAPSDN
ncbi:hypothetical protein CRI94_09265 [Longibacter salinarum]|uniref:DUF4397 domain-containing protein n=1 Tax=Longibacter salinarum TaxID=1850348 RepID=A0A2A8CY39_9BACT|nr:DUF4397 domain-containing protein [Longibacter salinarum]PEN13497.1 hypothetical protein CRI94_09265 [Longibacter salinarum]